MAETRQMSMLEKLAPRTTRAEQATTASETGADDLAAYAAEPTKAGVGEAKIPGQQLRVLELDLISPAPEGQIRQEFDEERLRTLADSLKRSGVREPCRRSRPALGRRGGASGGGGA